MTSELDLLRAGVRFRRVPSALYGSVVQAQGPRDEAIIASLRDAVTQRQAVLVDIRSARSTVRAQHAGSLPQGICDTCGDPLVSVDQKPDGTAAVRRRVAGSGMCSLCSMARLRALTTTEAAEAAKEAA